MIRRILAVAILALAAACGGGDSGAKNGHVCEGANTTPPPADLDYAGNFTGTWIATGSLDAPDYGLSEPISGRLVITSPGTNKIALPLCDEAGTPALVTGPSSFETVCYVCPAMAVQGCSHVEVTFADAGLGQIDDGTGHLSLVVDGSMSGCDISAALVLTIDDAYRLGTVASGEVDAIATAAGRLSAQLWR